MVRSVGCSAGKQSRRNRVKREERERVGKEGKNGTKNGCRESDGVAQDCDWFSWFHAWIVELGVFCVFLFGLWVEVELEEGFSWDELLREKFREYWRYVF